MTSLPIPGWTCPELDALAKGVRRHVREEDARTAMLVLIESLRRSNAQLRTAARTVSPAEVDAIEARTEMLLVRLENIMERSVEKRR